MCRSSTEAGLALGFEIRSRAVTIKTGSSSSVRSFLVYCASTASFIVYSLKKYEPLVESNKKEEGDSIAEHKKRSGALHRNRSNNWPLRVCVCARAEPDTIIVPPRSPLDIQFQREKLVFLQSRPPSLLQFLGSFNLIILMFDCSYQS